MLEIISYENIVTRYPLFQVLMKPFQVTKFVEGMIKFKRHCNLSIDYVVTLKEYGYIILKTGTKQYLVIW